MARIRSVKPELFTSATVASLPVPVRWTFVGLLTYADDQGRGRDEARLVKAAVWPMDDDMPWQQVAKHLDELERAGLICRYEIEGKQFLHVSGWSEHQAISHPAKPKLPECPKASHRNPPEGRRQPSGESPEERGETPLGTGNREQGKEQGTTSSALQPTRRAATGEVITIRPDVDRLCELLADGVQATTGERPKRNKRGWTDPARLLLDRDGYTAGQVEQLIRWSQADEFWRSNILSMSKLRDNRLTLIAHMQRGARASPSKTQVELYRTDADLARWSAAAKEADRDDR